MQSGLYISGLFALLCINTAIAEPVYLRDGDIVFQTSKSSQSRAIQLATHSQYSHMGMILFLRGKPYVYEAAGTVRFTPYPLWVNKGENRHVVVKRLRNIRIDPPRARKLRQTGRRFKGKPYDLYFGWSDQRIYCSELVWKIYQRALGVKVGWLQRLSDFDLRHPDVRKKLKERYGKHIPLQEKVVSPESMFTSEKLVTVYQSGS